MNLISLCTAIELLLFLPTHTHTLYSKHYYYMKVQCRDTVQHSTYTIDIDVVYRIVAILYNKRVHVLQ